MNVIILKKKNFIIFNYINPNLCNLFLKNTYLEQIIVNSMIFDYTISII